MRDVVVYVPEWLTSTNNDPSPAPGAPRKLTIIYFITGNPGLIGYYECFLNLLAQGAARNSIVAGASLGGFETSQRPAAVNGLERELLYPSRFTRKPVYDLRDQIDLTHKRLNSLLQEIYTAFPTTRDLPIEVTFLGHSVGAYIVLEVIRVQHSASASAPHGSLSNLIITATMLLTPTIIDIAHSPSGKLATPLLSNIPFFPALIQAGAGVLAGTMPLSWLRGLVSQITGMKQGSGGLEATVQFLRTPGAVKQALYLARCEMVEIGSEEWKEEVWGVSDTHPAILQDAQSEVAKEGIAEHAASDATERPSETEMTQASKEIEWKPPKHYFLFAKQDHWVADATRDAIVEAVGGRATIVVDEPKGTEKGLVHAWCLEQNEAVAEIVNGWLEEVLN